MQRILDISLVLILVATVTMTVASFKDLNDGRVQTVVNQLIK